MNNRFDFREHMLSQLSAGVSIIEDLVETANNLFIEIDQLKAKNTKLDWYTQRGDDLEIKLNESQQREAALLGALINISAEANAERMIIATTLRQSKKATLKALSGIQRIADQALDDLEGEQLFAINVGAWLSGIATATSRHTGLAP